MENFTKLLLFTVFFSIGAAALGTAVLYSDLIRYYQYKQLVLQAEESLKNLKALNEEYDELQKNLEQDPQMFDRAAMAVLGQRPNDINAVYPKASSEQLAAAKQALAAEIENQNREPRIPEWLERIGEPRKRLGLFLAGAALVILAFIFFGSSKSAQEESNPTQISKG